MNGIHILENFARSLKSYAVDYLLKTVDFIVKQTTRGEAYSYRRQGKKSGGISFLHPFLPTKFVVTTMQLKRGNAIAFANFLSIRKTLLQKTVGNRSITRTIILKDT